VFAGIKLWAEDVLKFKFSMRMFDRTQDRNFAIVEHVCYASKILLLELKLFSYAISHYSCMEKKYVIYRV